MYKNSVASVGTTEVDSSKNVLDSKTPQPEEKSRVSIFFGDDIFNGKLDKKISTRNTFQNKLFFRLSNNDTKRMLWILDTLVFDIS